MVLMHFATAGWGAVREGKKGVLEILAAQQGKHVVLPVVDAAQKDIIVCRLEGTRVAVLKGRFVKVRGGW